MGRSPCCSKHTDLNRGAWTAKEDMILKEYVRIHGETGWRSLPKNAGLKRCGKSCRLRWLNYLRPDIKRGNISSDEDELIIRLHGLLGNRWSLIAGRLPGRTDNEIKNYWNTHLSKKQQRTVKPSASPDNDEFMKITPVKATAVRIANVCRKHMGSGYSTHKTTESVKTMKSPRTWSEFLGGDVMTDYNSELINSTMAAELGHPFPEISGQYSPEDFPIDEFDELKGSPGHLIEISSIYNGFGQDDAHWIHEFQDFQMSSMSEEDDFSIGMHPMSSLLIHEKV